MLELTILVLCVIGIVNYNMGDFAAILEFICADESGKIVGCIKKY